MNFNIEKQSTKFLMLLIIGDLAFIFLHSIYKLNILSDILFSIDKDGGYAEIFQYIKEYWIVVLLLILSIKSKCLIYFSWSLLFIYLLLDDSLQIHENLGHYLVIRFDFQPMLQLRAQDFGELSVSMFFGFFLFTFIGISYLFSDKFAKRISKYLLILVLFLAFFGVLVDMLHVAIPWGKPFFALLEDGGEMIIMSIIVWYVFDLKNTSMSHAAAK